MVRPLESWYRLSKEEQDDLMAKVVDALDKVGGKRVLMCDSAWSSEMWPGWGVEEFPDIEAVQKHSQALNELNWPFQYAESFTLYGTKWER